MVKLIFLNRNIVNFSFTPFDPVFLTLGPLQFRYYGLMYVIIFLLCYFFINHFRKKGKIQISENDFWDVLFYGMVALIIGGRLGYILFYNVSYFIENPLKIFAVWEGGMSFHGGLIGVIFMGWIFCKSRKLKFWKLADAFIVPISLGVGIGRIGNFINGELYGRTLESTFYVPWGIKFAEAGDELLRHPSQFYELGRDVIIFVILLCLFLSRKKRKPGVLLGGFLFMYGLGRFFTEMLREPDAHLGYFFDVLTMGQLLCIPMMFVGLWIIFKKK